MTTLRSLGFHSYFIYLFDNLSQEKEERNKLVGAYIVVYLINRHLCLASDWFN